MAIDLVNAGTAVAASSTATFYPNYPASVTTGQFLLMQISVRDTITTPTCCASWVAIVTDSTGTGRQFLYYRFGTTTMGGSSTTVNVATSAVKLAYIYGLSGVSATVAYEGGGSGAGSLASVHCPEVTATVASFTCLGVATYSINDDNDVGSFVEAVGATWTKKYQASTTLGSDGTIGIQVATISAPPVTVTTATYTMAAADPWLVRSMLFIGSSTIPAATLGIQLAYLYQANMASA